MGSILCIMCILISNKFLRGSVWVACSDLGSRVDSEKNYEYPWFGAGNFMSERRVLLTFAI